VVTNGDLSPWIPLIRVHRHSPPSYMVGRIVRDKSHPHETVLSDLLHAELEIVSVSFSLVLEEYGGLKCDYILPRTMDFVCPAPYRIAPFVEKSFADRPVLSKKEVGRRRGHGD